MEQLRIFQVFEVLCLIIATARIAKLKNTVLLWSVPYMAIVVFVDVICEWLPISINGSNQWIFNLYLPFQHLYFAIIFYGALNFTSVKKTVIAGAVVFFVFYLIDLFIIQGFYEFNNYSFVLTAVLMILYSGLTLLRMVRSVSPNSIFSQPFFWISASCLIFFTGFATFFAVYFYYKTSPAALNEMQTLYHIITRYVISIHYLLLIIAIWLTDQRKIYDYYNNC